MEGGGARDRTDLRVWGFPAQTHENPRVWNQPPIPVKGWAGVGKGRVEATHALLLNVCLIESSLRTSTPSSGFQSVVLGCRSSAVRMSASQCLCQSVRREYPSSLTPPRNGSSSAYVCIPLANLDTGFLNEAVCGRGCGRGVWQTILPVLSRPLISVTGPVICTAGSSWHFLSQRQYARTQVQPLMYADTHGGTQPCTPIHVCPAFPRDTKGHCRDAPPW